MAAVPPKMGVEGLNLYYRDFHALKDINLNFPANKVTALIGPSGCGKSTLLKTLNRMNDLVEGCRVEGKITLDHDDAYHGMAATELRRRVGMVFHLGRAQGPPEEERPGPVGRSAAAPVHRTRPGR